MGGKQQAFDAGALVLVTTTLAVGCGETHDEADTGRHQETPTPSSSDDAAGGVGASSEVEPNTATSVGTTTIGYHVPAGSEYCDGGTRGPRPSWTLITEDGTEYLLSGVRSAVCGEPCEFVTIPGVYAPGFADSSMSFPFDGTVTVDGTCTWNGMPQDCAELRVLPQGRYRLRVCSYRGRPVPSTPGGINVCEFDSETPECAEVGFDHPSDEPAIVMLPE